ncbi:hypothetical protein PQQ51_09865 [Paraburkholderia xenovorans]|uniref:hypothetical protein n=1 Tax=Paraburkholderia xenovorans TaxID=36873 RepID=UPI0038BAFA2B
MATCPLLRASVEARRIAPRRNPQTRVNHRTHYWLAAITTGFLGLISWRALRDILNAIPDSNDDFGLF